MANSLSSMEEGFRRGLEEVLADIPDLGRLIGSVAAEDAVEYGRTAARRSLAPLIWRSLAGDVLTTEQARALLGVSRQALHKRVEKGTLLGLPGERTTLYPSWQFTEEGEVRASAVAALKAFRSQLGPDTDPRMILSWTMAPQPELQDETPADWIRADGDAEPLLRAATRAAAALARRSRPSASRLR